MQQLVCPKCGETVSASNINVQELVAVCGNCDTVFKFESPAERAKKAKRRKVKQPDKLTLQETTHNLHMDFRTNFRLDQNQAFLGAAMGSGISAMFAVWMSFMVAIDGLPFLLPILFAMMAILWGYQAALVAYNKTHIDMNDERVRIERKPLYAFRPAIDVSLAGADKIDTVETEISIERRYDTPRFRVFVERHDGTQRLIVNDLTEDYAYFVSRVLNERLQAIHEDYDTTRLTDMNDDTDVVSDYQIVDGAQSQRVNE
ncbi:MAG: hypothetical protein AAFV98_00605 [Chloroflexota bacterium]